MQIINLDISKRAEVPAVHAKQHDVRRKFQAVITDGDAPYAIPKGAVFSVWYSGTGGIGNYSTVDGHDAFAVSGNAVTVELSPAMLNCKGGGLMCFAMNSSDGTQLGFWDIPYFVEALPGADEPAAQQYYDAFAEVVAYAISASEQAQAAADKLKLDKTLSVTDKAAEAAAVGKALEGKAPHGFGLGGAKKIAFSDLDSTYAPGWYYISGDLALGFGSSNWTNAFLRVDAYNNTNAVQVMYVIGDNNPILQRFRYASKWKEWEYVNPAMSEGVPYLTTQLYKGKPVYKKVDEAGCILWSTDGTTWDTQAALMGAAPAGFGLGGAQRIAFADLDNVRAPGWYYINGDLALWNDDWHYAYLRVDAFAAGSKYATQTLYIVGSSHTTLQRFFYGTNAEGFAWSAWEHVRPNMSVGVEYLTTELHNGKPVYKKVLNIPYPTSDTNYKVRTELGENIVPLYCYGYDGSRNLPFSFFTSDGSKITRADYIVLNYGRYKDANGVSHGYVDLTTKSQYGGSPTITVCYLKT